MSSAAPPDPPTPPGIVEPPAVSGIPIPVPVASQPVPLWAMIFGGVCLGFTLLFFMGLLVASLFHLTIPEDSRFLVVIVVAFGGAIGTGFLGGGAAVSGQVPIIQNPWIQQHPITFGASGGFAALVILLLIGPYILPQGATIPVLNIPTTPEVSRNKAHQILIAFLFESDRNDLDPKYQLRVQIQ